MFLLCLFDIFNASLAFISVTINSLPLQVIDGDGEERIVNVDTAISSEHARVEFDDKSGRFFICDGTAGKCSTNGTWYR